ncbi:multidrug transporter subunit MdtD [Desulfovibrio sp. OttesenSCG-928-M14]|nr:multidrug transporter subunit MdtD [Desulfovibrio sp. OttesenSCG-928-M14]
MQSHTEQGPQKAPLRTLLWVVGIAFFMQMLDASILNTALPAIAQSLDVSPLRMHAVVIAYMLTVAILIPASGWLADRFGVRRIFLAAILIFTLGSLACALSFSLPLLVASRVLQGIGGALLVPVGRLAILRAVPRAHLAEALSFITLPGLIGPLIGPTLGGLLVRYASWQWIFLINLPVGLVGIFLTLRCMPGQDEKNSAAFDGGGFLLFALFMTGCTLSMESLGEEALSLSTRLITGGAALAALALYVRHAAKVAEPLFAPRLFRTRNFTVGIAGNLFARFGMGAMPFLTPLLLQLGLGYSAVQAGLAMLPITLGAIIGKSFVSRLIQALGYPRFLTLNTLLVSAMLAAYALIDPGIPLAIILGIFTLAGIVNSLQFTGMNTIALLDLPDSDAGSGNSLLSAVMQLAMSMGVAMAAALLDVCTSGGQTTLQAFHSTCLVLAGVTAISSLIFFQARDARNESI